MQYEIMFLCIGLILLGGTQAQDQTDPDWCNSVDCNKEDAIKLCPVYCNSEPEWCRIADCSTPGALKNCKQSCNTMPTTTEKATATSIDNKKCALIVLHPLGASFPNEWMAENILGPTILDVRQDCLIRAPEADHTSATAFPPSFIMAETVGFRSWFDFKWAPSPLGPFSESKSDLREALKRVEDTIEELINEGVPSKNIVIMGWSQGGALTLYTAVNSQYKLGGFLANIAWMPQSGDFTRSVANSDTPILQVNGGVDVAVPYIPTGRRTKKFLEAVFSDYQWKLALHGFHTTTPMLPSTIYASRKWLKEKTNISA